jgi:hypothetical protein
MLWGGDNESSNIFKLQKKVFQNISRVSNRTSCRQKLTPSSLYILDMICFVKNMKIL